MVHAARIQRVGERTDHMLLPDQFGETLGTPLAGEDEVGHAAILPRRAATNYACMELKRAAARQEVLTPAFLTHTPASRHLFLVIPARRS
ncbi:hypothetical protein GCM10027430_21730 [Lysobacter tyrosinilyticus]